MRTFTSARRALLLVTAVAITACRDSVTEPVSAVTAAIDPTTAVTRAPKGDVQFRGRVTFTVRQLKGEGLLGRVIHTEIGEFVSTVHANGRTDGIVNLESGKFERAVRASKSIKRRVGRWSHQSGSTELRLTAAGGAPPAETEFRDGGVLVSRTANDWQRTADGWRLAESATTFYDSGEPVAALTLEFEEGVERAVAARIGTEPEASDALGVIPWAGAPARVCEAEVRSLDAAMLDYLLSAAAVGVSCGTLSLKLCLTTYANLLRSGQRLDHAADSVEECVEEAER